MAISFSKLGDKQTLLPAGLYKGTIEKVEVKVSKKGMTYLAITYKDIKNEEGKSFNNKMFDNLFDSESNLLQYKLKRFIIACGLQEAIEECDEFELEDLSKLIVGKTLYFDTKHEKQEGYSDKWAVDNVKGSIFYSVDDIESVQEINAEDAETDAF